MLVRVPVIKTLIEKYPERNPAAFAFRLLGEAVYKAKTKHHANEQFWDEIDILVKYKTKWFDGLVAKIKSCKIDPDELASRNWGIRESTGELILLDYGF